MSNTKFQFKRTTVSGRLPNTTNSANTSYIYAGEFAINLTDGKVVSSNGTATFEVGANLSSLNVATTIAVGGATINSTIYSATANNANNLGGTSLTTLQTQITGNAATAYTNATTYSANASNLGNGTVATARLASGTANSSTVLYGNGVWAAASGVSLVKQQFTGDGANTQFAVTGGYTAGAMTVYVNGVKQLETTDVITTSGANIAFVTAPGSNYKIDAFGFASVPAISSNTSVVSQQFTANGTGNTFAVSGGYTVGTLQVFVNGVKYVESSDVVTTSGANINFTTPPTSGSIIDVFGQVSFPPLTPSYLPIIGGTLSGTVNVGSNVSITTTGVNIGNSTANTTVSASVQYSNSTAYSNVGLFGLVTSAGSLNLGNTTANSVINTTSVYVYANATNYVAVNATTISTGNTTTNSVINSTALSVYANATNYVAVNATTISTGNSTVNSSVNATALSVYANATNYVAVNATTISTGNSTVNTSVNATAVSVGSNVATFGTALYSVANGNVGIGTSAPIYKLEVGGSARFGALNTQTVPTGNTLGGVGVTWNFTNAQAETNFWNLYTGATRAFQFSQITGVGTYTDIMTLSGNGNVGIGNTTPTNKLSVQGNTYILGGIVANGSIGSNGQVLTSNGTGMAWATAGGGGSTLIANTTDTQTFYIPMANTTTGTWSNAVVSTTKLYFVPSTGTLNATIFNSLSDKKFKTDIKPVTNALDTLSKIDGVSFKWKENGTKSYGVIAQEIEKILPELVDGKDIKSVNYAGIIAFLINAIKELDQRTR